MFASKTAADLLGEMLLDAVAVAVVEDAAVDVGLAAAGGLDGSIGTNMRRMEMQRLVWNHLHKFVHACT